MAARKEYHTFNDQESVAEMLNDSSVDRIMAIDLDWIIIAWNKTSEKATGIFAKDVLGKKLDTAFPQLLRDDKFVEGINNAFSGKTFYLLPASRSFLRENAENFLSPLNDRQENVKGVIITTRNVQDLSDTEERLQKLTSELQRKYIQLEEANYELATFTNITSHEIKEPLKHVYTSLELLVKKEAAGLSNLSKGNLRRIQGSLNKMNLLLDDILTLTGINIEDANLEQVNLDQVCANAIISLNKKIVEKNAVVTFDNLGEVYGNTKMLEQLFLNIIDNSIKFQPENASPEVRIHSRKVRGIDTGISELSEGTEYVQLDFTDNGIGFNTNDAARIFGYLRN